MGNAPQGQGSRAELADLQGHFLRVQEHPQNEEQEGTAQMVEVEAGNRLGIGRLASCVGMRPGRPKHRWI